MFSLALIGCSLSPSAAPSPESGVAIHGIAHGGRQAISGAHVYLFAAGTSGYGTVSTSLLNSAKTGYSDSIGAYVPTDSNGYFTITGDYTCIANTQVYIYILGGNTGGGGVNSASGLMAILGNCPVGGSLATAVPFVVVNEVITIAAAYAFAGFATDATHVSSSGSTLAKTGIANAFANASNLANIATGSALATTPAGNGTVPQGEIDTLANVLTTCVNSADSNSTISSPCSALFAYTLSGGTIGTAPTDTATAAINIAHNPGANIAALYGLSTPNQVFTPALSSQPNDFTFGVEFTAAGVYGLQYIAIDASGNAWVGASNQSSISKFSSSGVAISPAVGYSGGGLNGCWGIAIDNSGYVWLADTQNIAKFYSSGTPASPSTGYTTGGSYNPQGIAIDRSGYVWAPSRPDSSISKFSSTGTVLSSSTGFTGGGLNSPFGIAIDGSGNVWLSNAGSISEFTSSGNPISPSTGYTGGGLGNLTAIAIDKAGTVWASSGTSSSDSSLSNLSNSGIAVSPSTGYTGGGLDKPYSIAIDGSGSIWTANGLNNSISRFSNSGTAISPSTGYTGGGLNVPRSIAVDGSGNVWVAHYSGIAEFIGAATPVITPISAGLPTTPTIDGSSNLGTPP